MRILLDTHILLWAITDDRYLSAVARQYILDDHNNVILIAQAVAEPMRLLTHDRKVVQYGEFVIEV